VSGPGSRERGEEREKAGEREREREEREGERGPVQMHIRSAEAASRRGRHGSLRKEGAGGGRREREKSGRERGKEERKKGEEENPHCTRQCIPGQYHQVE
jgi:hypothetical protein